MAKLKKEQTEIAGSQGIQTGRHSQRTTERIGFQLAI
jgi:hypothetical protein